MLHEPSLRILDALTGDRTLTMTVINGGLVGFDPPGAAISGDVRIILAQATGGETIALPRGGIERLSNGALRIGGAMLTAAQLLNEISNRAARQQVQDAIRRFKLDPHEAVHVLAARAYVW